MPPWAQTEWERLTGTIENRSTLPPISAILMTAESPARPPPTTMILGFAAIFNFRTRIPKTAKTLIPRLLVTGRPHFNRVRSARVGRFLGKAFTESVETGQSHDAHDHEQCQTDREKAAARF